MNDTPPEIENKMMQMFAERSPFERVQMAAGMFDTAKMIALAGIKRDNPSYDEAQIRGELLARLYGDCFTRAELEQIAAKMPDMRLESGP
jgi:hypothetical protein